jgi:hypothetical protein
MRVVDGPLASLLLAAARAGSSMARVWPRRRKMARVLVTRLDPYRSLA